MLDMEHVEFKRVKEQLSGEVKHRFSNLKITILIPTAILFFHTLSILLIMNKQGNFLSWATVMVIPFCLILLIQAQGGLVMTLERVRNISKSEIRRRNLKEVDLRDRKWSQISDLLYKSFNNDTVLSVYCEPDNRLGISVIYKPKFSYRIYNIFFKGTTAFEYLFRNMREIWLQAAVAVVHLPALFIANCFLLIDMYTSKLGLVVCTGTAVLFKRNRDMARVLVNHEICHILHDDPRKKLLWATQSMVSTGCLLFIIGISAIFMVITIQNPDFFSSTVIIYCDLSYFLSVIFLCIYLLRCVNLSIRQLKFIYEFRADLYAIENPEDLELVKNILKSANMKSKFESMLEGISYLKAGSVISKFKYYMAFYGLQIKYEEDFRAYTDLLKHKEEVNMRHRFLESLSLSILDATRTTVNFRLVYFLFAIFIILSFSHFMCTIYL